MKKLFSISALLLATSVQAATDLSAVYEAAASHDAEIAALRATREANGYNVIIARGAILPQVQASYSHTQVDAEIETVTDLTTGTLATVERDYSLGSLEISASQTLFNLNSWYTYQAAKAADAGYDVELQLSEQQLLLNTAQAYFDVLRAAENLAAAEAEEQAVKLSLEQTRQRYDVGLVAKTDVLEAQAVYDLTKVALLSSQTELDISYEVLERLTGTRQTDLAGLRRDVALTMPKPANVEEWVESGLTHYPGLKMVEAQQQALRLQRSAARAARLPSVDLFASYSDGDNSPTFTDDTTSATVVSYGVQVSVPLFVGGSLYGQSRQAASNYAAIEYQMEFQKRQVRQSVRSLFRQLQTAVQNIDARAQAIRSTQSALDATQSGYEVGTRNIVEVLDAKKSLYQARRDYANARYDYILNLLNLKFYAGTLSEMDIAALNAWLES